MKIYLGDLKNGVSIYSKLDEAKHLLISAGTASGKTEFIKAITKDLIVKNDSEKIKFCLFDGGCPYLEEEIPDEYFLYGKDRSVVYNEESANKLLDRILIKMQNREKSKEQAKTFQCDNNEDEKGKCDPRIFLVFDHGNFLMKRKSIEKIKMILEKSQNNIHIIFSMQVFLTMHRAFLSLFPTILCGSTDEKLEKALGISPFVKKLKNYEFVLKSPTCLGIVKCKTEQH